ncbi:hypothetical protein MSG28_009336 [Choristoneura fumiferana]|uniref:Uncharacterized protein n=1 Tax=Choristoneura fumiferana TaxID=7141 RepID=A0ACC0KXR2_CHOFU|nr:hypothetical protein MSG28_009336 [Choristoneura fumiferana]
MLQSTKVLSLCCLALVLGQYKALVSIKLNLKGPIQAVIPVCGVVVFSAPQREGDGVLPVVERLEPRQLVALHQLESLRLVLIKRFYPGIQQIDKQKDSGALVLTELVRIKTKIKINKIDKELQIENTPRDDTHFHAEKSSQSGSACFRERGHTRHPTPGKQCVSS